MEVLGVSKHFGLNQALSNVSMRVPAGDLRALVGRNGAGKSTLVGVLTGILAPDAGRVHFAGQDAPGLAERQKWRDRVACVYQKSTLVPTLTVAENLLLNAQPTGGLGWIRWGAARREAERVLAGWGMELDVEQECARLSVEQRQIVEIARALIQGARFIILDEPTAELEGREVRRLFDRITHLQATGVTFLYISHYLEEIYEVCRSVTVLRDGRVVAEAPLEDMPKDRVVAAMVGDAARATGRRAAEPHRRTRRARHQCWSCATFIWVALSQASACRLPPANASGWLGWPAPARARSVTLLPACSRPPAGRSGSPGSICAAATWTMRNARASATCRATAMRVASSRCSPLPRT